MMADQTWLDPLLSASEMQSVDEWAIEERGVPSLRLMETAGAAVAYAAGQIARPGPVRVLCGKGNNGGDGVVAARRLLDAGYEVDLILLWPPEDLSEDSRVNLRRWAGEVLQPEPEGIADLLAGSGVVVDAIFGTGFSGSPRGPAASAIGAVNDCGAPVVAADIPSGVDADSGEVEGPAVRADVTVTFHAPKVGQRVAPGKGHCGQLRVTDIGIPDGPPVDASAGLIRERVLTSLPSRGAESTKFSSGRLLIVGGSRGMTGAACLCAMAAVRAGAGYAKVGVPRSLETIFETKLTEQMTIGLPGRDGHIGIEARELITEQAASADAVVIGPGLGSAEDTAELVERLLTDIEVPLLIDADGLGALANQVELIHDRGAPTVLTPHAGELGKLLGRSSEEVRDHRFVAAHDLAEQSGAVVALKGDDTIVCDGDRAAINELAAPGLATAGTGDVLAGMIGALLARGVDPFEATCAGVLAHARAGAEAAARVGTADCVIAGDVIEAIPAGLNPEP